jgi:hypothetical protein
MAASPEMVLQPVVLGNPSLLLSPPPDLADGGDAGFRVVKGIAHEPGAEPALGLRA